MHLASSRSSVPANPRSIPTVRISAYLSINTHGGYEYRLWVCISVSQLLLYDAGN